MCYFDYTVSKDFCKMKPEYAIKISLSKHVHDNPSAPYYWSLTKYDDAWHQVAFGWADSPQASFSAALKYYYSINSTL